MKKNEDKLDALFEKYQNQWDIHEPTAHHDDRFITKQKSNKPFQKYWIPFSIAASILLIVGFFIFNNPNMNSKELVFASKETKQTDSIFTAMIKLELEKVKEKKSPENEKIIADALIQMKILDNDYEKIKKELLKNGESRQIIHAMIRNLQTRISFLENVLEHIEYNENLINSTDEKTI